MYYIFDDPSYGFLLAAAVEIGALIYLTVSQRQYRHLSLLAGVAVAVLVWGLDQAVETNREQAEELTKKIVKATVEPDSGYIIGALHEDLQIGMFDREKFAVAIRTFFRKKQFSSNTIKSLEVLQANDKNAVVEFSAFTVFDQSGNYAMGGMATSKWKFSYQPSNNGKYKLIDIEMESMNNSEPPMNWQKEL